MTTETVQRNEAAERLRYYWTEAGMIRTFGPDLNLALAAERRLTVERIRAAWIADHEGAECEYPHERFDAILDEVADRP